MSTTKNIVLCVALLAVLALAAVLGVARATPSPEGIVTALTSDRDTEDGWPPTTGPTNPG